MDEKLTKKVIDNVKNIDQGFISPCFVKGVNLIRLSVGNYHSDMRMNDHPLLYKDQVSYNQVKSKSILK